MILNRIESTKEAWMTVTKRELVGWFFFTGVLSVLFARGTLFWTMGSDKMELSWLIYKFAMILLFVGMTAFLVKKGLKWNREGKNEVYPEELIRAFTGQLLFAGLLAMTLLVEVVSLAVRGSQLMEYVQGMLYFGIGTGFGMTLYLIMINHIAKKDRGEQGV